MVLLDVQLCILVQGEKDLPTFYLLHFSHASKLDQGKVFRVLCSFHLLSFISALKVKFNEQKQYMSTNPESIYMEIISLPVSCISNRFIYSPHLQRVMQLGFVVLLMSWNYEVIWVHIWRCYEYIKAESFNEMISTSMERGKGKQMSVISQRNKGITSWDTIGS